MPDLSRVRFVPDDYIILWDIVTEPSRSLFSVVKNIVHIRIMI